MTKSKKVVKGDWIVEATIDGTVYRFFYYNVTENTARLRTKRVQTSQLRRMGFTRKARKQVTMEIRPITVVQTVVPTIADVRGWYQDNRQKV